MERRKLTKDEIIAKTGEIFGVIPVFHSYPAMSKEHITTTYFMRNIEFNGADLRTFFKDYALDIYVFYKKSITADDFAKEENFERAMLQMGEFEKAYDYNPEYDVFSVRYSFDMKERINV